MSEAMIDRATFEGLTELVGDDFIGEIHAAYLDAGRLGIYSASLLERRFLKKRPGCWPRWSRPWTATTPTLFAGQPIR